MRVFIGVSTGSEQHVKSLRSVFALTRRTGDDVFFPDQFGTGLSTRITLEDAFYRSKYDALFLIDADQYQPPDLLEKLRDVMEERDLDMVTAHIYKRSSPIESLCLEIGDGTYPFQPMLHPPREGLHEIMAVGMGCVLIQKRVLKAVRDYLPKGQSPFAVGALPQFTGDHGEFGQDYRFFLLARQLGYKLWLRADVESLHGITLWLGHDAADKLFDGQEWANKQQEMLEEERIRRWGVSLEAFNQRKRILEARKEGIRKEFKSYQEQVAQVERTPEIQDKLDQYSIALYQMDGRLLEVGAWIEWENKYPPIKRPDQLPTNAEKPIVPDEPESVVKEIRSELYRDITKELTDMLPSKDADGRG